MQKKHNFGAGPCILPQEVLAQAAKAVLDWNDSGLSILEVSHRSLEFGQVMTKTVLLIRELLKVPADYHILLMQGGASTQFSMLPLSFLQLGKPAQFLDTGFFSQKAMAKAAHFGSVEILASSADGEYRYIPDDYSISPEASYFHCTSNNTSKGTQLFDFPKSPVPIFCDMSSDIFSRKIRIRDFDLIYSGAQKNMGPAGLTMVIIKKALLGSLGKEKPSMRDYRTYEKHGSLFNTPPVFSIYVTMLNLIWIKSLGGVDEMERRSLAKAKLLYQELDRNPLFYGLAHLAHRSLMNVTFKMYRPELEQCFLEFAVKRGMVAIQGFPTIGGFRVSLYNALPLRSVVELVNCMADFEILSNLRSLSLEGEAHA